MKIPNFTYDRRYLYWGVLEGKRYKDNGYGWWYPGEPQKGVHAP